MLLWAISFERCLFSGAFFVFGSKNFLKRAAFFIIFLKSEFFVKTMFLHQNRKGCFRFFRSKKRKHDILKKTFSFQIHYGHSKGNTPNEGGSPKL